MKFVTIKKFSELTGYTEKAIRNKIDRCIWRENIHWIRSPDNRIQINIDAIQNWILGEVA